MLKVIRLNPLVLFLMNLSYIAVLVASVSCLKGNSTDFIYFTERINDFLITAGLVVLLATVIRQKKNITIYSQILLRPFPKYTQNSTHLKVVQKFKVRVIFWGIFICGFSTSSLLSLLLFPWLKIVLNLVDKGTHHRTLPIGEVPWSQESDLVFWSWYLVSATVLATSILLYSCLLFTFIYSSLHITTKLKLLALDLTSLDDRAEDILEHALKNQTIPKEEKRILFKKCIEKLLKNIIADHLEIMR